MTNYANEIWKSVVGYEGLYSISSHGRLRRDSDSNNTPRDSIRIGNCHDRYHRTSLNKNGLKSHKLIHRLVAEAFIGICPKGMQVNHKDANKLNNHKNNLEYVTPQGNSDHASSLGLHPKGSKVKQSKLKENDIPKILDLLFCGKSCQSIARIFGVSRQSISYIKNNKTWKNKTLKNAGFQ